MKKSTTRLGAVTAALIASVSLVATTAPAANAGVTGRTVRAKQVVPPVHGDPLSAGRALDLINADRARVGLPPLRATADLNRIATDWAFSMGNRNTLDHNPNLSRQVTNWRLVGENVGVGASADQLEAAFMASPGHRANILRPEYNEVGIGAVVANGRLWIVHDFRQSK